MNIETFREFCLSLPGVDESFPFGEDTLVMKVHNKMFALASLYPFQFTVKCEPEKALELRRDYPEVQGGYHMNKKHWNTIQPSERLTDQMLEGWVKHSYELVVDKLPAKVRRELTGVNNL